MSRKRPKKLSDELTVLHRCPYCGWVGQLEKFEVGGADEGNIMCPECVTEQPPLLAIEPIRVGQGRHYECPIDLNS